tara:strand:- start:81 stop:428 length:348 start_codon:yes stop_codon:yes gene_type:complete
MVVRTIIKAGLALAKKKARQKKYRQEVKSLDKYNVHAAVKKGAVPLKKQSSIKSTLSGRQYSISNNKLSPKTILDLGGGYGKNIASQFQDNVKDLIGLDLSSLKKAQRKLFKKKK